MVKFRRGGRLVEDIKLCLLAQEKGDVHLMPGKRCFGDSAHCKGYVRNGVGLHPTRVTEGLLAAKFMQVSPMSLVRRRERQDCSSIR